MQELLGSISLALILLLVTVDSKELLGDGNSFAISSPESDEEFCRLKADTGPCKAAFTRFYFDFESKKCRKFTYGNCRGNRNNFADAEECRSACHRFIKDGEPHVDAEPDPNIICFLPHLINSTIITGGNCTKEYVRWFYDNTTKRCQQVDYNGCAGTENLFHREIACIKTCELKLNGTEKAVDTETQPKAETSTERNKEQILNVSKLENWKHLNSRCTMPPPEVAECKVPTKRYYFNSEQKKCLTFPDGKCGKDGGNRFVDSKRCSELCLGTVRQAEAEASTKRSKQKMQSVSQSTGIWKRHPRCTKPLNVTESKTEQVNQKRIYFDSVDQKCLTFDGNCGTGGDNCFAKFERCSELCLALEDRERHLNDHARNLTLSLIPRMQENLVNVQPKEPSPPEMIQLEPKQFAYVTFVGSFSYYVFEVCRGRCFHFGYSLSENKLQRLTRLKEKFFTVELQPFL